MKIWHIDEKLFEGLEPVYGTANPLTVYLHLSSVDNTLYPEPAGQIWIRTVSHSNGTVKPV